MRTVAVVTAGRSDFGLYRPILERIQVEATLALRLIVTGSHLSPEFGFTVRDVEAEGFPVADRIDMQLSGGTPGSIANSIGVGASGFGQAFASCAPDLLLVLGDRFEMLSAVIAALPFKIPVAHVHGGETTEGAIDESIRHAITKMSHVHFVSTADHGRRVVQMGEDPARVIVTGAPGLDDVARVAHVSRERLGAELGLDLSSPFLVVTYHPVTLEYEQASAQAQEVLRAIAGMGMPAVLTYPNADTCGREVLGLMKEFVASTSSARLVPSLGTPKYFSLLRHAAAMVGNSSSALIEAPAFQLPAVNIGNRQKGRTRAANVIDVTADAEAIVAAIRTAVSPAFRASLAGMTSPYGDGHASERIVETLARLPLGDGFVTKRFHDR